MVDRNMAFCHMLLQRVHGEKFIFCTKAAGESRRGFILFHLDLLVCLKRKGFISFILFKYKCIKNKFVETSSMKVGNEWEINQKLLYK